MHTLTALHQVPLTTGPRTLSLHAPEVAFTAAVALSGADVCGVQSPVTPSWHTTLRQHGVHPATLVDAQDQARHLGEALTYLQRRGVITAEELAHLAQERLLHALLPLLPYRVEMTIRPSAGAPLAQTPRVPVLEGVKALAALQPAGRPVHLSLQQAYAASPAQVVPEDDGTPAALVYRAALQGMTLQEMARRLPLRWDDLRRTVLTLTAAGDIWPAEQTRPGRVQPQLQAGELAPDFILPALVGPPVRLSSLRGGRVWLSFNRQSTCAICNPHHAAVIAVQPGLRAAGVQTVSIWGSSVADLAGGIGRQHPPYAVLADPGDVTYDRYGLHRSLSGTLDPRNVATMVKGFRMMGAKALKSDGELLRMPAEFLIEPDGRVSRAHYAAFGADFLPLEDVLAWAQS